MLKLQSFSSPLDEADMMNCMGSSTLFWLKVFSLSMSTCVRVRVSHADCDLPALGWRGHTEPNQTVRKSEELVAHSGLVKLQFLLSRIEENTV